MRPHAQDRARAYIASPKTPRAVAGQCGDKTTYGIACTLAVDFGLDDSAVRALLAEYNRTKCDPAWSEHDLDRFVRSARKCAASKPGDVGKLLHVDKEGYTGPRSPANTAKTPSTATPAKTPPTGAPHTSAPSGRTPRTPFFDVRRAGDGAEPRPSRTLRTDLFLSSLNRKRSEERIPVGTDLPPSETSGENAAPHPSEPSATDTPQSNAPSHPSAPSEPNDQTMVWANGEVWKKRAGATQWTPANA